MVKFITNKETYLRSKVDDGNRKVNFLNNIVKNIMSGRPLFKRNKTETF